LLIDERPEETILGTLSQVRIQAMAVGMRKDRRALLSPLVTVGSSIAQRPSQQINRTRSLSAQPTHVASATLDLHKDSAIELLSCQVDQILLETVFTSQNES